MPEIKFCAVSKKRGETFTLGRIDVSFPSAAVHGIIGPNGAGKTTLLRLMTGLLKPSAGEIKYFARGKEIPFAEAKPKIAYFPQEQSLYGDLSIAEHMNFFRELYRLPHSRYKTRYEELMALTRLGPFANRRAGQLSGGMYKKLGLMCVLLAEPDTVILDEPTIGVDPVSRRELWDLIYRLSQQGLLVILSTSYMDEAEHCGAVHLLESGGMIFSGAPDAALKRFGADKLEDVFLKISARGGGL